MKSKLTDEKKELIVEQYVNQELNISDLAQLFEVSTRTIGRVLDEAGYKAVKTNRNDPSKPVSKQEIINTVLKMTEYDWGELLKEIVTLRVSIAANRHAQTAMLNLEKKLPKND